MYTSWVYNCVIDRNPAATLKQLQGMLNDAQSVEDLYEIKKRMAQTIFDMEQETTWKQHLSGEGNRQ